MPSRKYSRKYTLASLTFWWTFFYRVHKSITLWLTGVHIEQPQTPKGTEASVVRYLHMLDPGILQGHGY